MAGLPWRMLLIRAGFLARLGAGSPSALDPAATNATASTGAVIAPSTLSCAPPSPRATHETSRNQRPHRAPHRRRTHSQVSPRHLKRYTARQLFRIMQANPPATT